MSTPNPLYLADACHNNATGSVTLTFANASQTLQQVHPVSPKLFLPLDFAEHLGRVPLSRDAFTATIHASSLELSFTRFSALSEAAAFFRTCLDFAPAVLSPERQLLLETGHGYFSQVFCLNDSLSFSGDLVVPDVCLPQPDEPIPQLLERLASINATLATDVAARLFLSHVLAVPVTQLSQQSPARLFLENVFFLARCSLPQANPPQPSSTPNAPPANELAVDFSSSLCQRIAFDSLNVSPETLDCSCCAPASPSAANVLPNSLLKMRFLSDGFYFSSFSPEFAEAFHANAPHRANRERFLRENHLTQPPLGPFYRNTSLFLPLADARFLEQHGLARFTGETALSWHCTQKLSILSGQLARLLRLRERVDSKLSIQRKRASSYGLHAERHLSLSAENLFLRGGQSALNTLLNGIPEAAASLPASLSTPFPQAFSALRSQALHSFQEFAEKYGHRIHRAPNAVSVDAAIAFPLAKRFSQLNAIPLPEIRETRGNYVSPR